MTTWVLLRGLAREAAHWGALLPMLRAALPPEDRVLTPDLPGNGTRHRAPSPLCIADMVEDCRARLDAPAPLVLVAVSLGGMVAVDWATRHPRELAGCVLINTSFGSLSPFWQRLRPAAWAQLAAVALPGQAARDRERRVLALTSNQRPVPAAVEAAWAQAARERPVSRANVLRQLVAAARYRLPAQRSAVPMLVLASRADRLCAAACSLALAARWSLPLELHASAGHDLPLDDPAWVVRRLLAFGARHGSDTEVPCARHPGCTHCGNATGEPR